MFLGRYELFLDVAVILLAIALYLWKHGPPSKEAMHDTIEMLNTKGGIILLLWVTSLVFFFVGIRMVYWGVNMMIENKLSSDNALILSAFNWITGAAFGGAFGAMIKTMTGEEKVIDKPSPSSDQSEK
jgi:uncharacterized membrane protein